MYAAKARCGYGKRSNTELAQHVHVLERCVDHVVKTVLNARLACTVAVGEYACIVAALARV